MRVSVWGLLNAPKGLIVYFRWLPVSFFVDLSVGELVGIVGSTGAGKSGLLLSLLGNTVRVSSRRGASRESRGVRLGEVPPRSNSVALRGTVAYCSQVPWIQSATLKENILFGADLDENWLGILSKYGFQSFLRAGEKGGFVQRTADEQSIESKALRMLGMQGKRHQNSPGRRAARGALFSQAPVVPVSILSALSFLCLREQYPARFASHF